MKNEFQDSLLQTIEKHQQRWAFLESRISDLLLIIAIKEKDQADRKHDSLESAIWQSRIETLKNVLQEMSKAEKAF